MKGELWTLTRVTATVDGLCTATSCPHTNPPTAALDKPPLRSGLPTTRLENRRTVSHSPHSSDGYYSFLLFRTRPSACSWARLGRAPQRCLRRAPLSTPARRLHTPLDGTQTNSVGPLLVSERASASIRSGGGPAIRPRIAAKRTDPGSSSNDPYPGPG